MKREFCIWMMALVSSVSLGQDWNTIGNLGTNPGTNYLGTQDNNALMLRTNATQRFRLNHNVSYVINGFFPAQVKNGALGLSPNNTLWTNGPGPFSRLHLHDGTTSVLTSSYRPWMDNGITFTTNSDQMYVGHKVEAGTDQTAAVIQWGDNDAPTAGPDVMKFIFSSAYSGGSGQNSTDGLEIGRFHPGGWFGLGNWQAGANQPDERLDLLNRTIRLRDFTHPTLYKNNTYDRILVANPSDGRVYWRDASTFGGCSSGWSLSGNNAVTAFNGNPCPPQAVDLVGIGTNAPMAKLDVLRDVGVAGVSQAILATSAVNASVDYGIVVQTLGVGGTLIGLNAGVVATATNAIRLYGAWDRAIGVPGTSTAIGTYGYASNTGAVCTGVFGEGNGSLTSRGVDGRGNCLSGAAGTTSYGVYGQAYNAETRISVFGRSPGTGATHWAGYFDGRTYVAGTIFTPSDSNLKSDIEPVTSATEMILGLHPKTYHFNTVANPFMGLPQGRQFGFLAQELEQQFPEMVIETIHPAEVDSLGGVIHPAMPFKAVSTGGIIPILVAAFQEQYNGAALQQGELEELRARVEEQSARLDQLEQALSACCANPANGGDQRLGVTSNGEDVEGDTRKLLIQPNPFNERTTANYTLERAGRMQLLANSADGKQLRVLQEANLEAGAYQYEWNTADLAAGVYYVTLLLDGRPVVKKAVKVNR